MPILEYGDTDPVGDHTTSGINPRDLRTKEVCCCQVKLQKNKPGHILARACCSLTYSRGKTTTTPVDMSSVPPNGVNGRNPNSSASSPVRLHSSVCRVASRSASNVGLV